MGEWGEQADATVYSLEELRHTVRAFYRKGVWSIAYEMDPSEMPDLVEWLIPIPDIEASPVYRSGGAALLVDECDLFAPQGSSREEIRTLYRRSRHAGLSVISTTQRPETVSREVTAMCEHAVALHLSEPRALDYVARVMRLDRVMLARWQHWTRQHPHGGLWKNIRTGETLWLPETGPPQRAGPPGLQRDAFSDPGDAGPSRQGEA
jgi:hypothetical protein